MAKKHKGKKSHPSEAKEDKKHKKSAHIPLIPVRSDSDEMEDEMQEIFDEDRVTHRHGVTEPERD